jgi:uncharacterized membrane protein
MDQQILSTWGTTAGFVRWLSWNVFLALIPVVAGWVAARVGQRVLGNTPRGWLLLAPLLLLWLAFMPNSCYLLTDLRHFVQAVDRDDLWVNAAAANPVARSGLTFWLAVAGFDLVAGCLTFLFAVRPVKRLVRAAAPRLLVLEPFFFWLVALGLYLGVVTRSNSWELFTQPTAVLREALVALGRPYRAAGLIGGGILLWAGFELLDATLDGILHRWRAWVAARRPVPPGGAELAPGLGPPVPAPTADAPLSGPAS